MKFNFLNRKPKSVEKALEAPEELTKIEADNVHPHSDKILSKDGMDKIFQNNAGASKLLKEIQEEERQKKENDNRAN